MEMDFASDEMKSETKISNMMGRKTEEAILASLDENRANSLNVLITEKIEDKNARPPDDYGKLLGIVPVSHHSCPSRFTGLFFGRNYLKSSPVVLSFESWKRGAAVA